MGYSHKENTTMIGYTTLGSDDFAGAGAFYDGILGELGAQRMMDDDHIILWATAAGAGMFAVIKPFNEQPATVGNGTMVAFAVESQAQVEKLYNKALTLGATDEGEPGPRGDSGMIFGYVRDPQGNKLAFYCMPQG